VYRLETRTMNYRDIPGYYSKNISRNDNVGLIYGRLSVSPSSYLEEAAIHSFEKEPFQDPPPALQPASYDWLARLVINFSKTGGFGRRVRWALEKSLERRTHLCVSRNQALNQKEPCQVTRNQEMYDSMGYLKNRLNDTDILQEYFLPPDKMP